MEEAKFTLEELGHVQIDLEDLIPIDEAPNRSIWSWENLDHRPSPEDERLMLQLSQLIEDEDVLAACLLSQQLKNTSIVEDELPIEQLDTKPSDPLLEPTRTATDVDNDGGAVF